MAAQVDRESPTGCLFSQPIVTSEGHEMRLDALLGNSFAVVAKSQKALSMSGDSLKVLEQIGARAVNLEGVREVQGHIDRGFEIAEAIIVRPDRYAFGHVDEHHSLDELIACLAGELHLIY